MLSWQQLGCGHGCTVSPEDLHPNPLEVCADPPAAVVVFAVMMLKTGLSFANLVLAPAGSSCESFCERNVRHFSAFSSFLINAGSCYFYFVVVLTKL